MYLELLQTLEESRGQGSLLDELWWDSQHEKKNLREKFELLLERFERFALPFSVPTCNLQGLPFSDMRSRTGIVDALESGISWNAPATLLTAGEKKWREDVRKERAEAKRLELESAQRRAEIEDCDPREFMANERAARMMRVFVATRGPGP